MTVPFMDDQRPIGGLTISQWHTVARNAHEDLQREPNNPRHAAALTAAQRAIRAWTEDRQGQNARLARADQGPTPSTWGGRTLAAAQGFLGGFAEEAGGLLDASLAHPVQTAAAMMTGPFAPMVGTALLSRTPEYQQGTERSRAYLSAARSNDPVGTTVADIGGIVAQTAATGGMLRGGAPWIGRLAEAATRPGQTVFQTFFGHLPAKVASTAIGAGEIGAQTALRAAGESDEGDRLPNAALGGVAGGVAGLKITPLLMGTTLIGRATALGIREARAARAAQTMSNVARPTPPPIISTEPSGSVTIVGAPPPSVGRPSVPPVRIGEPPLGTVNKLPPFAQPGQPAARPATPQAQRMMDTEALFRRRLTAMGMRPEDIETAVQRARQTQGSPLYRSTVNPAPPDVTGLPTVPAPRTPVPANAPLLAPEDVPTMVRGRHGAQPAADVGAVAPNQIDPTTRVVAGILLKPPTPETQQAIRTSLQGMAPDEQLAFRGALQRTRGYLWRDKDRWGPFFMDLLR